MCFLAQSVCTCMHVLSSDTHINSIEAYLDTCIFIDMSSSDAYLSSATLYLRCVLADVVNKERFDRMRVDTYYDKLRKVFYAQSLAVQSVLFQLQCSQARQTAKNIITKNKHTRIRFQT